ncbi:MAG: ATP-dependent helicase [Candidatus Zambryskibacteria bacterium]|nr:ATP-dependent helicase [Candidatus Zambryskibacteria bacterium]
MKSTEFEKQYKKLNPKQKEAVNTIEGPVMVIAGPGTGKTTILTLRIANILLKTDTKPENILALTFTNSGVSAIRKNLIEYMGDDAYRVNIFTFHAFAENIIKEFSFYFKELESSKIISDLEKLEILEEIMGNGKFKEIISKNDLFSSLSQIKKAINSIKKEGLNPEEFESKIPKWEKDLWVDENLFYKKKFGKYSAGDMKPAEKEKLNKKIAKTKEIAKVFREYQKKIKEKSFYDFDDMILNTLKELEKNQNLKLDLQEQYQYLLIDEHQDTNDGQNRLIELLTDAEHLNGKPNLFTVGDEKQSIYRFQGASEKTFRHFNEIYEEVEIINLEDNYRSTQNILDSSHSLIEYTIDKPEKLKACNKSNDKKINYLEFSNYKFELLYIAEIIKNKIEKEKINPKEIAVIYRSNRQVNDLKNILDQKNIPFTVISKEYLLEDPNINNLISILKVINNPKDNYHLAKSLLVNFLKLDSYKVVDILNKFNKKNRGEDKVLFDFIVGQKEFKDFVSKIKSLKTKSANVNFDQFFKEFLSESRYLDYMLESPDSRYQLIKIDKLFDEIKRQIQNKKGYSLDDFIKFINLYKKYNLDIETKDPEVMEGIQLMTAHRSKGLEFEYVFIVNATRKSWEKSRGFGSIVLPIDNYKGNLDDERRLFYVSMTRAKKELYITSSLTDWEGKLQDKSQFITEIKKNLIKNTNTDEFEKKNIDNLYLFIKKTDTNKSLFDKKYLKNLFFEKNLNVTALNNYLECPNKYLFRNLIQLPSEYSPILLYGNLIHDSLEKFFEESKNNKKISSKKELVRIFKELIERSSFYGKEYERYLGRGIETLGEYHNYYHKNWTLEIENEKYIRRDFELGGGKKINISGRLDKIEFLDSNLEGRINIVDYKTGRPFSDKTKKQEKENLKRQLVFYYILYENFADNKFTINQAILDFVEKNKNGQFEQYSVPIGDKEIKEVKNEIRQMAQEVLSGDFLDLGCNKKDCQYCTYRKLIL